MARITTVDGFPDLTAAESQLIAACRDGLPCKLGDGTRPTSESDTRTIRAALLALLITGGSPTCGLSPYGVQLTGAYITGTLRLSHCKARGDTCLNACHFTDEPMFDLAQFQLLGLQGSHLPGLFAEAIRVKGSLYLRNLTAKGTIFINGAEIGGQVSCDGANLEAMNPDGTIGRALAAQSVKIGASLFLANLTAKGTVDIGGARISGQLACDGANLDATNPYGIIGMALNAQGVECGGEMFLRNLTANGTVDVAGARISGQLACEGANLDATNPDGTVGIALNAQGVETGADMILRNLRAKGMVTVTGARIGGQLDCYGANLDATNSNGTTGKALNAQGVETGASLFLTDLTAKGMVDVNSARIGGQLACNGASLSAPNHNGTMGVALNAQRLHVAKDFMFYNLKSVKGQIDLATAHVGVLVDDLASWPKSPDEVILNGFSYDRIIAGSIHAQDRLKWLENGAVFEGTFHPQPYTQLAKVLSEMGHERASRRVLREREALLAQDQWSKDQTRYHALRNGGPAGQGDIGWHWLRMWSGRLWFALIRLTAGYGYAPERALYWTFGFLAFGALFYFIMWQLGAMVPNSAIILTSPDWAAAMAINPTTPSHAWTQLPTAAHYETFYALPYAADVFAPLVDLGQQSAWSQTTVTWSGWFARIVTWVLQITGWVITALGAAAVTGIIKRDRG